MERRLNRPVLLVLSADRALGVGTMVGSRSWFVYDVDPAPHRGTGRRPDRMPDETEMPNGAYVASIRRTFRGLLSKVSAPDRLECAVDGRLDYKVALRLERAGDRLGLAVYPNPKRGPKGSPRSPEAIARDWAMFPVDQLHQLLRHTCSDHKRETISFGRRLESILGRAHLIAVWKNFIRPAPNGPPIDPRRRCGSGPPTNPGAGSGCSREDCSRCGRRCRRREGSSTRSGGRRASRRSRSSTRSDCRPQIQSEFLDSAGTRRSTA